MILVLLFLALAGGTITLEAWMFMLTVGMVHFEILDAVHPISYGVAMLFVLLSLPVQALGIGLGAMGDA